MTKSKAEANNEILLGTKEKSDNEISQINVRDLNSTHPIDCICPIHEVVRFDKQYSLQEEIKRREELNYSLP
jgi:hypothetical protein